MKKTNREFQKTFQRAVELHRGSQHDAARALYLILLKRHPRHPDVLHFYGLLCYQTGGIRKGIDYVKRSLEYAPEYLDALNNLGNMLKLQGDLQAAQEMYERVLALQPDFYDAMINLGVLARSRQQHDEAERWYRRAIATKPDMPLGYHNLTRLLMKLGQPRAALEVLSESVNKALHEDDGQNETMHSLRARLMLILEDKDSAVTVYKEWLDAFPDSKHAQHMLSAATGENIPEKSDPAYVKELFDSFSETFDEVLDKLEYRAPGLVGQCVSQCCEAADNTLAVLDAGCGTGLCGQYLAPYAKRLTGIDISTGMLARAYGTEQYDELVEAEIVGWLSVHPQQYDLIVSADTLNYFGDLTALFEAARTALVPAGKYVFTLEMHEILSGEDYILNLHGRYSHSIQYIQTVMDGAGLAIVNTEEVVLRLELGKPVNGYLIMVQRR